MRYGPFITTLASLVCAVFGISDPGMQTDVKAILAAAAGLVVAVYTWQHHRTIRHADNLAAQLHLAQLAPAPTPAPAPLQSVPARPPAPAHPEPAPGQPMTATAVGGHQVLFGGVPTPPAAG